MIGYALGCTLGLAVLGLILAAIGLAQKAWVDRELRKTIGKGND